MRETFLLNRATNCSLLAHLKRGVVAASLILAMICLEPPRAAADGAGDAQRIGRSSQLPLPRFATLKTSPARLRRGPGLSYPILWELTRRQLPVKILAEYGHWRRVALHDGERGWIHKSLLSGRRYVIATGEGGALLEKPAQDARRRATVGPATPLRLLRCRRDWCQAERQGVRGWMPRAALWGADAAKPSS